jgi:hypothetical protein
MHLQEFQTTVSFHVGGVATGYVQHCFQQTLRSSS